MFWFFRISYAFPTSHKFGFKSSNYVIRKVVEKRVIRLSRVGRVAGVAKLISSLEIVRLAGLAGLADIVGLVEEAG
jgi:hypothetical protein